MIEDKINAFKQNKLSQMHEQIIDISEDIYHWGEFIYQEISGNQAKKVSEELRKLSKINDVDGSIKAIGKLV